jgi:hypothetical protein
MFLFILICNMDNCWIGKWLGSAWLGQERLLGGLITLTCTGDVADGRAEEGEGRGTQAIHRQVLGHKTNSIKDLKLTCPLSA